MNLFNKVPITGDTSNPLLIAICLIASIILLVVVIISSKINNNHGKYDDTSNDLNSADDIEDIDEN